MVLLSLQLQAAFLAKIGFVAVNLVFSDPPKTGMAEKPKICDRGRFINRILLETCSE